MRAYKPWRKLCWLGIYKAYLPRPNLAKKDKRIWNKKSAQLGIHKTSGCWRNVTLIAKYQVEIIALTVFVFLVLVTQVMVPELVEYVMGRYWSFNYDRCRSEPERETRSMANFLEGSYQHFGDKTRMVTPEVKRVSQLLNLGESEVILTVKCMLPLNWMANIWKARYIFRHVTWLNYLYRILPSHYQLNCNHQTYH